MLGQRGGRARRRRGSAALAGLLASMGLLAAAGLVYSAPAYAQQDGYCYAVGGADNVLVRLDPHDASLASNELTIGSTGASKSDALAVQPRTGQLFTVHTIMRQERGYLGSLNPLTGAFTARPYPFGIGQGELGEVTFFDVSGLAFDPVTDRLYAVHVRTGAGEPDALFQVDALTGRHVPEAFGAGNDYAALLPLPAYPDLWDVDDIAIDPASGQMYGILNNSWSGDRLVRIDKQTGAIADVGAFGVAEVEGLSFDPHGQLWATAGGWANNAADKLYEVDAATGRASRPRPLDHSDNYEGLACLTPAADLRLGVSAAGTAAPAEVVTYTLRYANVGNQQALRATLTETLPAGTTFYPAASAAGWKQAAGSNVFTYALGALEPGASGTIHFAVRVDQTAVGPLANTAEVGFEAGHGLDLNPQDNGVTHVVEVAPLRGGVMARSAHGG